jgi:hypothetical protein
MKAINGVHFTITAKLLTKRAVRKPPTRAKDTCEKHAAILAFVEKHGHITNAQASLIGGWKQPGYHLRSLQARGLIERTEYGKWRWKCQACGKVPVFFSDCECLT